MNKVIIMLIISTQLLAQNLTNLDKGQVAPFSGKLIKVEIVEKLVKDSKKVIVLEDLRMAQESLIEYHKQDAKVSRRRLSEAKFDSYMNVLGSFLVGVLATSIAFRINSEVNR